MTSHLNIFKEINNITEIMVKASLAASLQYPVIKKLVKAVIQSLMKTCKIFQ